MQKKSSEELDLSLKLFGRTESSSRSEECEHIYDVNYEMKKLRALSAAKKPEDILFCVNPAFWRGLDIVETKSPVL